ncbi:glycosyltransferase [Aestuariivivens sediminis]|uniref:glycosyltransferase n=1 Tax=Aestuariivivens sediminis TaxID=2913557 RepID=UPI001F577151|nr:glycosyltransferase [Aestuariivivens sediminis]
MDSRIAVLLPHYNNHVGLQLTLQSLIKETEGFTVFIIEDCSEDLMGVERIIKSFNHQLDIVLLINKMNLGIVKSLNRGLEHIIGLKSYDFIARLDAGDICLDNRFKQQKELLVNHKDIGLVGSWVRFVDMERNKLFDFKPPCHHDTLKKFIHKYNPFVHPSVMYKKEVIEKTGLYPLEYPALEDHAFFFKVLKSFKVFIIPKILLEYEVNPYGVSAKQRKLQTASRVKLFLKEYNFTIIATYGILRSLMTHVLPISILTLFKKKVFYK